MGEARSVHRSVGLFLTWQLWWLAPAASQIIHEAKSQNSRWQLQLSIRERICQQELVRVLGFAAKVQFLPFFEWQVCLICLWIPTFSFPPLRFDSGQAMCSPLATSRSGEIPAMGECNFSRIYTEALALKIHGLLWTTFWVHPALSNPSFQLDSELHGRQSDLHVVWKKGCFAQKSSIGDEKVWLDGVEGLNSLPLSSRNWDCRVTGAKNEQWVLMRSYNQAAQFGKWGYPKLAM